MISSLEVITLTVGKLATNCYLLVDKSSKSAIIIDPGDDGGYIIDFLTQRKIKPKLIIATHGHFDHIMAAAEVQLGLNIPFYIHEKDEFLVNNMNSSSKHFLGIMAGPIPLIDGYLRDDEKVKLGHHELEIISTPGHSPGSVCLLGRDSGFIFSGDLIFAYNGVGRTDFSYSSEKDLEKSLKKVLGLSPDTLVYPGHGESFRLGEFDNIENTLKT